MMKVIVRCRRCETKEKYSIPSNQQRRPRQLREAIFNRREKYTCYKCGFSFRLKQFDSVRGVLHEYERLCEINL